MSSEAPDPKLREGILGKDIMLKMFTSGTTGLPKAAMITHMRAQNYMHGFAAAGNTSPGDVMLMVLPLYHATGGLCGLGSVLTVGGTCALERKFSASRFWPIAKETGATHFMYVGELCRFLVNAEPNPLERAHAIRCAMGNGLRPDVWTRFQERFAIKDIVEFYGATEGNVSLINFDGRSGAVGRVPWYLKSRFNVRVARFDTATEQLVRGPDGLVVAADVGETGEMLGEIRADDPRFRFDGYAGDDEQTKKKIARDVVKKGDMWFRTGDLMRQDKDGYFYFVDRIGDTYRWKSENVATSEVAEALGVFDGVQQANVYGVEVGAMEGRAGMAALVAEGALDLQALRQHLERELPAFARPLFIRVQNDAASHTTGTFKMRKVDLVKEGFDPREVQDALYFNDPEKGAYVPLDQDLYAAIQDGRVRV